MECSGCHKSVTAFTGTVMSHAAIGDTGSSATGNACDACHEFGYRSRFYGISINWTRNSATHYICGAAGTPSAPNITICGGGGSDCLTGCHQHTNQIPTKYASVRPGTPKKQIQAAPAQPLPSASAARPLPGASAAMDLLRRLGLGGIGRASVAALTPGGKVDHAALGGQACQSCHNGVLATAKGPTHPRTTAACADCHSTMAWQPVRRIDHADVLGTCASCHTGTGGTVRSAGHPVGNDCDRCHTTSAWTPAAFDHSTVLGGTCASCHDGQKAPGKSPGHLLTTQSCDTCHYVLGWKPTKPTKPALKTPAPQTQPLTPRMTPPRLVPPRATGQGTSARSS